MAGRSDRESTETEISDRYGRFIRRYLEADRMPAEGMGLRSEPFTLSHPRLTPDREAIIRRAVAGTDPRGSRLPAWMVQSLLAGAIRAGAVRDDVGGAEVLALLAATSDAALRSGWDARLQRRVLAVVFAGLRPPGP